MSEIEPTSTGESAGSPTPNRGVLSRWNTLGSRRFMIGAVVVVAVVVGAFWAGGRMAVGGDPLATCEASLSQIKAHLQALEDGTTAGSEDSHPADSSPADSSQAEFISGGAFQIISTILTHSDCDPDTLVGGIDLQALSQPTKSMVEGLIADLAYTLGLTNIPEGSQAILATTPGPQGQAPQVVPDELADGDLLVLFVGETGNPDTYQPLKEVLEARASLDSFGGHLPVYVVSESAFAEQVAARFEWEVIEAGKVPFAAVMPNRPVMAVVRNGAAADWVTGEGAFENAAAITGAVAILDQPYDPAAEPVISRLYPWEGACDGNVAMAAVVNRSDRPIHLVAVTDSNATFDEEGMPISNATHHDLGVLDPWGHLVFQVPTGQPFYAPCWFLVDAFYADGKDLRGTEYEPGPAPVGFIDDPAEVLAVNNTTLPVQVIPKGFVAQPSDVTPIADGHPQEVPPPLEEDAP